MPDFRLAYPFALILLLPMVFLLWRWQRGNMGFQAVMRYSDTRLLSGLPTTLRLRLRQIPNVLRVLAWLLLLVALARPQFGTATLSLQGSGIDIVFALDISDSMGTGDFNGLSRLDAAKFVITNFVRGRTFDRMGLVVFAEEAFYQSPPTLDYDLFLRILDNITYATQLGLGNRSAIGMGIATATNMLQTSTAKSKIVILMTDGANNAGTIDPLTAAQVSQTLGVQVYAIGMGASGTDSDLDEVTLQRVTTLASGRYFNALATSDLEQIYQTIDQLEQTQFDRQVQIQWQDQAFVFVIATIIVLVIERLLRQTIFQTIP
jgi:Ca-activated chloride channel homolog